MRVECFSYLEKQKDEKKKRKLQESNHRSPRLPIIRAVAARVPDGRKGGVGESAVLQELSRLCVVCVPAHAGPHAGFRLLLQIISLLSLHQQQQMDGGGGRKRWWCPVF